MQFAELVLTAKTEGLKQGARDLDGLRASGARAESGVGRSMDNVSGKFDSTSAAARRMGAALAAAATAAVSVGAIFRGAEKYTGMINGLRGMGLSAEQAALALGDVSDIANRTRSPLEATSQLYRRVSVAAGELGASQQDLLRFTENVGLALAASGTGANEASGALLQLSQAMAGGTVRAEEFNSILEGAFPIAQAAARGIDAAGGSVGRLRQLVVDGKISSEAFFDAIISQTPELEAAFANTVPTVGQAMTVLGTNFTMLIGQMDNALGVTGTLASGLLFLGQNLDQASGFIIAGAAALTAVYAPAIVAATVATGGFIASLITLRGALIASGIGAFVVLGGMAVNKLLEMRSATDSWGDSFKAVALQVKAASLNMSAWFIENLNKMIGTFIEFTWTVADGLNNLFNTNLQGMDATVTQRLGRSFLDLRDAAAAASAEADGLRTVIDDTGASTESTSAQIKTMEGALGGAAKATKAADDEVKNMSDTMEGPLKSAVNGVSRAWADFVVEGFNDFQDFTTGVLNMFKRMLSEMIALAASNQIMISMGIGGSVAGSAASAATGGLNPMQLFGGGGNGLGVGTMLANTIGGGGLLAGTTFGAGLSASLTGGFAGASGAIGAGLGMGGLGGIGMALGAAAPYITAGLALASGLGLFGGKKTPVNQGFNVAVGSEGLHSASQFNSVRTSGGLFRGSSMNANERSVDAEMDAYLRQSIDQMQNAARTAAEALELGTEAFDGFSHSFQVKLDAGASPEQVMAAVNEELARMGDLFAGALPQFSSFNELMEAANERVALQDRLLEAQGNETELLARQREREMEATHEVNKAVLGQIYALEDQARAQEQAAEAARKAQSALEAAERARLEVQKERLDIEDRLLELQGRGTELLARQREREMAAVDASNRALLEQVFALEDKAASELEAAEASKVAAQALEERARAEDEFSRDMMGRGTFATSADRQFAATSFNYRRAAPASISPEERSLLIEIVTAIREGNLNNARKLTDLVRMQERRDLEPIQ